MNRKNKKNSLPYKMNQVTLIKKMKNKNQKMINKIKMLRIMRCLHYKLKKIFHNINIKADSYKFLKIMNIFLKNFSKTNKKN